MAKRYSTGDLLPSTKIEKMHLPLVFCTLLFFLSAIHSSAAQENSAVAMVDSLSTYLPEEVSEEKMEAQVLDISKMQLISKGTQLMLGSGLASGQMQFSMNGDEMFLPVEEGRILLKMDFDRKGKLLFFSNNGAHKLYHVSIKKDQTLRIEHIPLWLSLLPPLLAIILALVFKEVIISLFSGIWIGSFIASGMRLDSLYYLVMSFLDVVKEYIVSALNEGGHLSIIVFSILIGGMVAIISRNGGMAGVVLSMSKYAKSPKTAQFTTWLLGIAIFFDDYANTLIVGNTMRAVTDKFKVSREKLAYIVDSTAAPVAAVAFVTTWIGAELGYIGDGLQKLGLEGEFTPYAVFLSSLKFSFYPFLCLIFILIIIRQGRDFGPMLAAERKARQRTEDWVEDKVGHSDAELEEFTPVANSPKKWYHAAIPVLLVINMTVYGLIDTGLEALRADMDMDALLQSGNSTWAAIGAEEGGFGFFRKLGIVIGASDSYIALLWASLTGVVAAIVITVGNRIMSLTKTIQNMIVGFKTMMPALLILTMAWALAITTEQLHTAEYFSYLITGKISPFVLPIVIFILAALIAFSTGSSWSTMAILYPIAIPTSFAICQAAGLDYEHSIQVLYATVSTVLAASVLGDHCSPISDTTILSSLATNCDHIEHVRTQMPYALIVGGVSIVALYFSIVFAGVWWVMCLIYVAAIALLWWFVRSFGGEVE
jgi:Na+/H+ antiporter NhaC